MKDYVSIVIFIIFMLQCVEITLVIRWQKVCRARIKFEIFLLFLSFAYSFYLICCGFVEDILLGTVYFMIASSLLYVQVSFLKNFK